MNFTKFLTDEASKGNNKSNAQTLIVADAWKNSNYLYWNCVMNSLVDSLYNVYHLKKTTKELQDSLDKKYKIEDVGAKKFVVDQFLDYKMVDLKDCYQLSIRDLSDLA